MSPKRSVRSAWLAGHVAAIALLAPAHVAAADPPEVGGLSGSATLIVILLLGSLTAGLFFASPLSRRLGDARRSRASGSAPGHPTMTAELDRRLVPAVVLLGRAQRVVDGAIDAVGDRLVARGRRLGTARPTTPLPPMLGGDIFFDDEPTARRPADAQGGAALNAAIPQPNAPAQATAAAPPAATSPAARRGAPWSTGHVDEERYWRMR